MGHVVVVGSISIDLTVFGSPMPRPGETVIVDRFTSVLGGKGANQAVAAARAGAETSLIGAVGEDVFADLALTSLREAGVHVEYVRLVEGATGVAHIRVDSASGENDIAIVPEANGSVTPEIAEAALLSLAERDPVVLVQLETPVETVVRVAQVCSELSLRMMLDPAPALDLPEDVWTGVDCVCPNETEAERYSGVEVTDRASAEAAARWFLDRGVQRVVITRGGRGTVVVTADEAYEIPAFAIEPVDTTAAGDSFAGALGAALADGLDWPDALRRAAAAGALAATVPGASPSIPTAEAVTEFLARQS